MYAAINAEGGGSLVKTIYNSNVDVNTQPDSTSESQKKCEETILSAIKQEAIVVGVQGSSQGLSTNFNSLTLKQTQATETHKKLLAMKIQVKQKARELIEQQIKDQKLLLKKFEQAKTVEEKSQILSLVKKLNESIEKEKDILNNKINCAGSEDQTSDFGHSQFSFQKNPSQIPSKPPAPKSLPAPPHSLKLNNMRYNQSNFLKTQAAAAQQNNNPTSVKSPLSASQKSDSSKSFFNFSSQAVASVDSRPRKLIISGVENSQEKEAILNFVNAIGCQVESASEEERNETSNLFSFIISFCARKDAEIALAKCSSSLTSKTISITWYRSTPATPVIPLTAITKEATEESKEIKSDKSTTEDAPSDNNNTNTQSSIDEEEPKDVAKDDAKLLSEIDSLLDDDKSNSTNADTNVNTTEEVAAAENDDEQQLVANQNDIVDALFDDSANYETETVLN